MSEQDSILCKDLRKVLYKFAQTHCACEGSLEEIKRINSIESLKYFIEKYDSWINDVIELSVTMEDLNTEKVKEWLDSPFVSDYDKNAVITHLKSRGI